MQQITASKKYPNGIQVSWTEEGRDKNDFFSYEDLIDLKINAFDLLNDPRSYRVNVPGHKIETMIPGCRSRIRCGLSGCESLEVFWDMENFSR